MTPGCKAAGIPSFLIYYVNEPCSMPNERACMRSHVHIYTRINIGLQSYEKKMTYASFKQKNLVFSLFCIIQDGLGLGNGRLWSSFLYLYAELLIRRTPGGAVAACGGGRRHSRRGRRGRR